MNEQEEDLRRKFLRINLKSKHARKEVRQLFAVEPYNKELLNKCLKVACNDDCPKIIELLLSLGADVNYCSSYLQLTPLITAAIFDDEYDTYKVVSCLLKHGARVNDRDKDGHAAADTCWSVQLLRQLLSHGANIEGVNNDGDNLLLSACRFGEVEKLRHLVEELGMDINYRNYYGRSAILLAAQVRNVEAIEYLLSKGANLHDRDSEGNTPILLACTSDEHTCRHRVPAVELLLSKGANITDLNNNKDSVISLAAEQGSSSVIEFLSTVANLPKYYWHLHNKKGLTPILVACELGYVDVLKALVAAGANIFDRSEDSVSALMYVCFYGHLEATERVLSLGVNVNEISKHEYTALALVAMSGKVEVMKLLIAYGADVNLGGDESRPILCATKDNNLDAIDLLVRHEAELNFEVGIDSYPLLLLAAKERYKEAFTQLLLHGAKITCRDNPDDREALFNFNDLVADWPLLMLQYCLQESGNIQAMDVDCFCHFWKFLYKFNPIVPGLIRNLYDM